VTAALELSLAEIRSMSEVTRVVTMECAGNGRTLMEPRAIGQPWGLEAVSTSEWTGVPLRSVLELAGVCDDTIDVIFTGADRGVSSGVEDQYRRGLSLDDAMVDEMLLAYEMNGRPLEPQNGAPLRLVAPGWYGMAHVKWLTEILASTERFDGIQHDEYRYRLSEADPGEPVTRLRVRSLMTPPGIPENFTRQRFVAPGEVRIRGRAWSGVAPISQVEVAVGRVWHVATPSIRHPSADGPGRAGPSRGTPSPASTYSPAGRRTPPATFSRPSRFGTSWASGTMPHRGSPSASRSRPDSAGDRHRVTDTGP